MDPFIELYYRSDWWQMARSECLKLYNHKCYCCSKPYDLQAHHYTYDHLCQELRYQDDLVCLCKSCHEWIENKKRQSMEQFGEKLDKSTQKRLLLERKNKITYNDYQEISKVIDYFLNNDLCAKGKYDLLKNDVFREFLNNYDKIYPHHALIQGLNIQGRIKAVRYEIILSYLDHGWPAAHIQHNTGFSENMIYKIKKNPEEYRKNKDSFFKHFEREDWIYGE